VVIGGRVKRRDLRHLLDSPAEGDTRLQAEAAAVYQRALGLLEGLVADDHPTLVAIRRNVTRLSRRIERPIRPT